MRRLTDTLMSGALPSIVKRPDAMTLKTAMETHPELFTTESVNTVLDAALMTLALHTESRVASLMGKGFYTIGPAGEELMSPIGIVAEATDPLALHYRHLAVQLSRRLKGNESKSEILLARARGFCVSASDPVTGGAHCALGGGTHDFLVTSTLASQTCPAVGRALGGSLAHHLKVPSPFPTNFVSFFSLGDGSVNNGHYLSGENLANFAAFRSNKVPLLTCVTDNGISISFKNHGYVQQVFTKKWQCKVITAHGDDVVDMWLRAKEAFDTVRSTRKPAVLLVTDLKRRFGHAATDRQAAYLSAEDIKRLQANCVVTQLCAEVVHAGLWTPQELHARMTEIQELTQDAFDKAHVEEKLTSRSDLLKRVSAPLQRMPEPSTTPSTALPNVIPSSVGITGAAAQVMRKHMTKVFDDALADARKDVVYIGEDVIHGGYYMVTDGLAKRYPLRVQDFPPDETSLLGVGMGYCQSGLLPIVEIPYAKYLDCAMDMFTEACIMNWLSNGKQPNGMVIRLQGFGRGVFGGNYHTHNMLHMPPGLDVVCYSNGRDYARGMRYALQQARGGRVSMFVDCTELLNMREVEKGVPWEMAYTPAEEFTTYDDVQLYPSVSDASTLIVTYGSGVPIALQAQSAVVAQVAVDVCDCPLLSTVPQGLKKLLETKKYRSVLFADICKEGQHPLASHMAHLMNADLLDGVRVRCATAQRTYNPLGTVLTFLSKEDIIAELSRL
jgi:2-oxoisovalerate dehydrogenase E1 component